MSTDLILMLRALSDLTRLRLLNLLADKGNVCVCDLERAIETGQANVSRHLAYLKNAGWVQPRRERTWVFYSLRPELEEVATAILTALRKEWEGQDPFRADRVRLDTLIEGGACHSMSNVIDARVAGRTTNE